MNPSSPPSQISTGRRSLSSRDAPLSRCLSFSCRLRDSLPQFFLPLLASFFAAMPAAAVDPDFDVAGMRLSMSAEVIRTTLGASVPGLLCRETPIKVAGAPLSKFECLAGKDTVDYYLVLSIPADGKPVFIGKSSRYAIRAPSVQSVIDAALKYGEIANKSLNAFHFPYARSGKPLRYVRGNPSRGKQLRLFFGAHEACWSLLQRSCDATQMHADFILDARFREIDIEYVVDIGLGDTRKTAATVDSLYASAQNHGAFEAYRNEVLAKLKNDRRAADLSRRNDAAKPSF